MSVEFAFKADVATGDPQAEVQYPFTGVASSTSIDRQGERITEKCLTSMAEQVPMVLAVAPSHAEAIVDVMAEAGTITAFKVEDGDLHISGELDPAHPNAAFLWGKMQAGNQKLSIAGRVLEARKSVWDANLGKHVVEIDSIELDHVLLCRSSSAVNQDTSIVAQAEADWADAIFKAAADIAKVDLPEDVSFDDLRELIYAALDETYAGYSWIVEIFENTVVVEAGNKYYRHPYTYADGTVTLGDAEEVKLQWVALTMAKGMTDEPSDLFVGRVERTLKAVAKVTTDRDLRTRTLTAFVDDLKADALSGNPVAEGKIMSDLIDQLGEKLEALVNGSSEKASAPEEEPSAAQETAEEPAEAEKSEDTLAPGVVGILQSLGAAMKSIDERLAVLETLAEEEPAAEKAEELAEEEAEAEQEEDTAKAEDETSAEGEAPAEDQTPATDGDLAKALQLIVDAVKEVQASVEALKTLNAEQEARLQSIEKASPTSSQVKASDTNTSETVAGGSAHPIQDMITSRIQW